MKKNKKVLFVVHLDTFFNILCPTAKYLQEHSSYVPLFLFATEYETLVNDLQTCSLEKFTVLKSYGRPLQVFTKPKDANNQDIHIILREKIKRKIPFLYSVYRFSRFCKTLFGLHKKYYEVLDILEKNNIDIIILAADIVHYDTAVFIKAAHSLKIPAIINAGFVSGPHEHWDIYRYHPDYQWRRLLNRVYSYFFPHWLYEEQGIRLVRLPWEYALPREILGLAPPKPWVVHSGYSDLSFVQSQEARNHSINDGFNQEKIVVTGSVIHDQMANIQMHSEIYKKALCQELNLSVDLPIIFVGLNEIDFTMHSGMLNMTFNNNFEYTEFLIKSLASISDYSVIVSLHPSMIYEEHTYIEEWGVKIIKKATYEIMPLCDIYIANVSSTINWAIACGKPVILYDVCRSGSQEWDSVGGVYRVELKNDFLNVLMKMTSDKKFYTDACEKQENCADYWGILDGKAGDRLVSSLEKLI